MIKKTAAIYARFSTDKQDPSTLDVQKKKCAEWAMANGYEVVATFQDAAISGATIDRPDFIKMRAELKKKPRAFNSVIVYDLSRLSRNIVAMLNIVFDEWLPHGVEVFDVSTNQGSRNPSARMTFSAMGISNDHMLMTTAGKTRDALANRAEGGNWAGGRVYGYKTIVDPESDPKFPRKVPVVSPEQGAVVQRIFADYLKGQGLADIADALNQDKVPAPYDDAYSKKAGKGWGHTTIRNILKNERYTGKFVWNKRRWLKDNNGNVTGFEWNPEDQWKKHTDEALRIIDEVTFKRVQKKFCKNVRGGDHHTSSLKNPHLLSGLLRCAECGSTMQIVGKGMFGCAANKTKGAAICGNKVSVSELKVNAALAESIRSVLAENVIEKFVTKFQQTLKQNASTRVTKSVDTAQLDQEISSTEATITNLVGFISKGNSSDAISAALVTAEQRLSELKARRNVGTSVPKAKVTLDAKAIREKIENVGKLLTEGTTANRDALRRIIGPLALRFRQEGEQRFYDFDGLMNLGAVIRLNEKAPGSDDFGTRDSVSFHCGGRGSNEPEESIHLAGSITLNSRAA